MIQDLFDALRILYNAGYLRDDEYMAIFSRLEHHDPWFNDAYSKVPE